MEKIRKKSSKKTVSKKQVIIGLLGLILLLFFIAIGAYNYLKRNNLPIQKEIDLYIPTGATYNDVVDSLQARRCIVDLTFFNWLAYRKNYPENVKPGRYILIPNMSINTLLNKLKAGNQDPERIVIGKFRTRESLAGKLSKRLEFDSTHFIEAMRNKDLLDSFGVTPENSMALFIPNTYEIYWNSTPQDFLHRMHKEADAFWTEERLQKAATLQLSRIEVMILASIIDEETNKDEEKPLIASVYLNRLRRGMLLQADPTVKFSLQDFEIRRILKKHLAHDGVYNTYKYKGLPPGPICIPAMSSIDAVLQNEKTDYLFFCAKEDFSGYHNFASNINEHIRNARKFQRALNDRKIFK